MLKSWVENSEGVFHLSSAGVENFSSMGMIYILADNRVLQRGCTTFEELLGIN